MKKLVAVLISGLFASAAFAADPAPAAEKTASAPVAERPLRSKRPRNQKGNEERSQKRGED